MNPLPVPEGIPSEDWAATTKAVQTLVHALLILLTQQQQTIQPLQQRVADLEARLKQNSQNSSKPPSSDPHEGPKRPTQPTSGRQPGGQPGHPGHGRKLVPPEQVDQVIATQPTTCAGCGKPLRGTDPQPGRHQVVELPVMKALVIEYQRHTLVCEHCGAETTTEWPDGMPSGCFGPRLQATVGYLARDLGASHRAI